MNLFTDTGGYSLVSNLYYIMPFHFLSPALTLYCFMFCKADINITIATLAVYFELPISNLFTKHKPPAQAQTVILPGLLTAHTPHHVLAKTKTHYRRQPGKLGKIMINSYEISTEPLK